MLLTLEEQERYAEENMKLVHFFANRYRNTGVEYEELFGIASLGYARAIRYFDLSRNVKFATYAGLQITSALNAYIKKKRIQTISLNKKMHQDLMLEDMLVSPDNSLSEKEIQILLDRYVKNNQEQTIMRMYIMNGYTQMEIASVVGCSQKFVSQKIRSLCNRLKDSLDPKLEGAV